MPNDKDGGTEYLSDSVIRADIERRYDKSILLALSYCAEEHRADAAAAAKDAILVRRGIRTALFTELQARGVPDDVAEDYVVDMVKRVGEPTCAKK